MEINTNSSHNAYKMYKLMDFCNLMKITGKKYRMMSKKLIYGQTYMKFVVVLATSKMKDTQLTYYNFAEDE